MTKTDKPKNNFEHLFYPALFFVTDSLLFKDMRLDSEKIERPVKWVGLTFRPGGRVDLVHIQRTEAAKILDEDCEVCATPLNQVSGRAADFSGQDDTSAFARDAQLVAFALVRDDGEPRFTCGKGAEVMHIECALCLAMELFLNGTSVCTCPKELQFFNNYTCWFSFLASPFVPESAIWRMLLRNGGTQVTKYFNALYNWSHEPSSDWFRLVRSMDTSERQHYQASIQPCTYESMHQLYDTREQVRRHFIFDETLPDSVMRRWARPGEYLIEGLCNGSVTHTNFSAALADSRQSRMKPRNVLEVAKSVIAKIGGDYWEKVFDELLAKGTDTEYFAKFWCKCSFNQAESAVLCSEYVRSLSTNNNAYLLSLATYFDVYATRDTREMIRQAEAEENLDMFEKLVPDDARTIRRLRRANQKQNK